MAETSGALTAYDLSIWQLERQKELPSREAREADRLLRLISDLQTARSVIDLLEREIKRLQTQLRFVVRGQNLRFAELRRLQCQLTQLLAAKAEQESPAKPRKAGAR